MSAMTGPLLTAADMFMTMTVIMKMTNPVVDVPKNKGIHGTNAKNIAMSGIPVMIKGMRLPILVLTLSE